MTRTEALERVVEAARNVARAPNVAGVLIDALRHHLDTLDTLPPAPILRRAPPCYSAAPTGCTNDSECTAAGECLERALPPAPQPAGEVVEVRAAVSWHVTERRWEVRGYSGWDGTPHTADDSYPWKFIATITARVPLPTIPTIPATVEQEPAR
jgi:hypothetical protein